MKIIEQRQCLPVMDELKSEGLLSTVKSDSVLVLFNLAQARLHEGGRLEEVCMARES